MSDPALRVLAGDAARRHLRERGLDNADVAAVTAASGGPKWLGVYELDRVVFGEFLAQGSRAVNLLGSSSGSWRLACAALPDARAAFARFEHAYRTQRYPARPSPAYVTGMAWQTLEAVFARDGAAQALAHPRFRLNLVTVRLRGSVDGSPRRHMMRLGAAALGNLVHRRSLGLFVERILFHSGGSGETVHFVDGLPTRRVALDADNFSAALLATGSIPGVMEPVIDVPGAGPGVYYDGGLTDYHFDGGYDPGAGLTLQPHFYPHLVPGWFDKPLRWRRNRLARASWTVVLAPSETHLARLPHGKVPDREDFLAMSDDERERYWLQVAAESERLADEFRELVATGRIAERVEAL
ncbi:patatin-like phospholipase family protein [Arhodomonas sp. AD133]|uniref:patatin-like phospholipase family protein n=1 Tax=Arhodomonas sp. AD133 TaxID=3415009 RepID=UPI003EB8452B